MSLRGFGWQRGLERSCTFPLFPLAFTGKPADPFHLAYFALLYFSSRLDSTPLNRNPKRPSFDSDEEVDEMDELTTAFEADDDDEEYDSGDEGDGNGGMMIISQEEVERSWVADR